VTLYYFHYRDVARAYRDAEGSPHDTLESAKAEGRQSARELLGVERDERDAAFLGGIYEITGDDGQVLAVVHFDEAAA
jgi:hypothetical protein